MVTPKRAGRIVNAIKKPDEANVGLQATESAEHGLIWLANIARNAHRVSRTLTPAQLKNAFTDVDKYNVHHIQHQLEESWNNALSLKLFKALTEKQMRRGWKPIKEKLRRDLLGVQGVTTKCPGRT